MNVIIPMLPIRPIHPMNPMLKPARTTIVTSFLRSLVLFAPFAFRKFRLHLINNSLHFGIQIAIDYNGAICPPSLTGRAGVGLFF